MKASINLNNFSITKQIGKGCFFEVFLIKENSTKLFYSAKVLIDELKNKDDLQNKALMQMLAIIQKINHPSILQFIGYSPNFFTHINHPTIITDFMPYGSLNDMIRQERKGLQRPEWNDTTKLINIYGIASAISYLHSNNILHRDICPSNILLDRNVAPNISGFFNSIQGKIKSEKNLIGTPPYIAPEIFKDNIYSEASDVYAFGITVFEIITGQEAYEDLQYYGIYRSVLNGLRPKFKKQVPESYRNLIERCWAGKPSSRPSFNEICIELKRDKGFITDSFDESDFFNYVYYIDNYEASFSTKKSSTKKSALILSQEDKESIKQPAIKPKIPDEPLTTENEKRVRNSPIRAADQSEEFSTLQNEIISLKKKIDEYEEMIFPIRSNNNTKKDNIFIEKEYEEANFKNLGQISEGATSITYKVIDQRTVQSYCKKVLKYNNDQTNVKDAQNALKEFEVLQQIDHPCICKAFFINVDETIEVVRDGETEDVKTIAIYLEYLDYRLTDFLASKFSNNTMKTKIVVEIVHAMNHIHKKGMIHRDLKMENIMLNSIMEAKLVDFGLVRINECVLNGYSYLDVSLTKGIGTFGYMSPEMLNEDDYDSKTDVYSFGVVLHFIFYGSIPKQNLKEKTAGNRIQLQPAPSKISSFGIELITKCLSPNPDERPSFDQILKEMRSNSFYLVDEIDKAVVIKRDKELEMIEIYLNKKEIKYFISLKK